MAVCSFSSSAFAALLIAGLLVSYSSLVLLCRHHSKFGPMALNIQSSFNGEEAESQLAEPRRLIGGSRRLLLQNEMAPRSGKAAAAAVPRDGIRVDLLHRDHKDSPLRETTGNLTLLARIRRDVRRSRDRADFFSSRISGMLAVNAVANFESPVSATLAEYVMSLSLGTPPQRFNAVVDTGSDLVWLQCNPCTQCFPQTDAVFNSARSSTYRLLTCSDPVCHDLEGNLDACSPNCQYTYTYGDQSSTSGDFSSETVTLGTTSGGAQAIPNFAFGCGHKNQGTFSSTDGLVGLGQGSVSFSSQLGALFGSKFSYCLVSREEALSQTSPLLFGDAAVPVVSSGQLKFTPLLPNNPGISTFYYVGLEGLSVGGSLLNIASSVFARDPSGSGGTIFDSGTTFTQLASSAYDAVINAFQLALPYPQVSGSPNVGLDLCFNIMGVQNVVVPELTFHFTNANFDLPADNYFVLVDNAGTMCLAISRSTSTLNIYGNTQQQNFQILYDRQNARLGFTPLPCSSL